MRERPIGVFDSGVGGLTVVREIMSRIPCETVLYYADTAHMPYGPRPLAEIEGFALEITDFLIRKGAKAICIACNMSSAVVLDRLSRELDIPVFGMVPPGAAAAAGATRNGRIGVLATEGTVKSGAYRRAITGLKPDAVVLETACPPFVPLVENGLTGDPCCRDTVATFLQPLLEEDVDTVVLGCTHYPFLEEHIRDLAGDRAVIVDPARRTVAVMQSRLERLDLLAENADMPQHTFYASGDDTSLRRLVAAELGLPDAPVYSVDMEKTDAAVAR
ncbi:MAG: glutamate racemase [bacterium]|nr:glutamate racemase [bacterium]